MKGVTISECDESVISNVSIHTPNEGSDLTNFRGYKHTEVSIHTPNEGSDVLSEPAGLRLQQFQSTLPMKGVTTLAGVEVKLAMFQSTLPMKGVTVESLPVGLIEYRFNPHSQ